jgi:ATP-dependent Clp protease ATP-binding subunit ClpB
MTDAAKELLAREGFDTAFGARPLKRAIQRLVIDPLAMRILEGQISPGETIYVDAAADGTGLRMSREPTTTPVN